NIEQIPEEQENFFQISGEQYGPVSVSVKDETLYLQADETSEPTVATVGVHQLNQLLVDGSSSVISKHLTSPSFSIDANSSGSIELHGMVTLDRILSSGKGPI